jgi:hypothetical protein
MTSLSLRGPLALALFLNLAAPALASCGSSFCTLMTDRYAQGAGEHPGWSTDLRFESVTQDRLHSGSHDLDASQVTGEEAIERHTKNQNLVATLGWGLDEAWSLSLRLPLVRRDHGHDLIDPDTGNLGASERWQFTRLADVQLLARRRLAGSDDGGPAWAAFGGLKLPTGSTRLANADGTRAERALQPGSGTTDGVLGIAARQELGVADALLAQASWTQALNTHEDFKPGRRVELSLGWSHAFSPAFGAVLQLNARQRGRDQGAQAEPDNSGSTTLDLSPGLTWAAGPASTLYAYVQRPLVQKVNGIQLVPRAAFAAGWTRDF